MKKANLNWIKMAVPWRSIEPSCKNCIDWDDLDRVVLAASQAGLKILACVDHQPAWSRTTAVDNGPPDDTYDYADFVSVMAKRYKAGSAKGTIDAIEVWNEPNLDREWGGAAIDREQASQYMHMLKETYTMVKAEDPTKIIVSAGLSPTGTSDGTAQPDDVYLGWLYEEGLAKYSDAIGVHGAGFSPPACTCSASGRTMTCTARPAGHACSLQASIAPPGVAIRSRSPACCSTRPSMKFASPMKLATKVLRGSS